MNTLPRYPKTGTGRFDFRVPDGFGRFVWPDWDDPALKVELYDADNILRVIAQVNGAPALTPGDDYEAQYHPEGGKFVAVEAIALSGFSLGVAEARVYAKVDGVEVFPYPTALSAFEVIEDTGAGPLYSTVARVRAEVPGTWPEAVTDAMVTLAIADASRRIDAFLAGCYCTPFPDAAAEPSTPPVLENICRNLAAYQCLTWMGRVNDVAEQDLHERAQSLLMRLIPADGRAPLIRLAGYDGPVAVYAGRLAPCDEEAGDVVT
jgi:hypothetical protein